MSQNVTKRILINKKQKTKEASSTVTRLLFKLADDGIRTCDLLITNGFLLITIYTHFSYNAYVYIQFETYTNIMKLYHLWHTIGTHKITQKNTSLFTRGGRFPERNGVWND